MLDTRVRTMTTRSATWLAATVILATPLLARPAAAQSLEPAGIHRPAPALATANARSASVALLPSAPIEAARVAHGVLIGAGVGAAAGIIVAAASPHSSHADNELGYIAAAGIGAFVGMVAGGVIGAAQSR